jgi:hypothetical protein
VAKSVSIVVLVIGLSMWPCIAVAADDDADDEATTGPIVSIDLSTVYASAPGFGFSFGLPRLSSAVLSAPTSKSLTVDVPLKIEFNDRFFIYAGIFGSTQSLGSGPWSSFQIDAWRTGFSADIVQQQGAIPTVTLTGSVSRPFDHAGTLFKTTTWSTGLDLDRALDAEETFGLLAGASVSYVAVDRDLLTIRPTSIFYVGGYRQFDDWKLTGQLGVQHFGGAQLAGVIDLRPATMPFVRFEAERLDEDDNRLLAMSATFGWSSSKLAMQLTLNVPIYLYGR